MSKKPTKYYVKAAADNGLQVNYGAKHIKITGIDQSGTKSSMMIPHELKGNGTEHAIRKWFLRMGILVVLSLLIWTLGTA